jgi:hypothetical protein
VAVQALAEVIERVALEGKIRGPVIGPVPELVQETSVAAIAQAAGPVRCRRTAALAQIASVIGLSHPAPGSVRVTTLLVGAGLTEAPLDLQVTAEVPAWEALDSAVAVAEEEAHVLGEERVEAVAGVEGSQAID